MDGSAENYNVTAAELRAFIERIEQSRASQADEKAVEKEIFGELKARGYMTRPVRTLIKIRAQDPDKRAEEDAVLEMYMSALGMD